jgi:DNA-binding NtrC family response regulator
MGKIIEFANYKEPLYTINSKGGGMIGRSESMLNLFHYLNTLADLPTTVLFRGETGTGKELCAKALHYNCSTGKRQGNFVAVNCAGFNSELLESELFGHIKGSFTGAYRDNDGKFQYAENGTILLDEIGEMPKALQVKLLRVLQEKQIMQVGSNNYKKINARVIAATNKDLEKEVEEGNFREDLYYRLNVVPIRIPSLSEKKEDISLIANYLIKDFNDMYNTEIEGLSSSAEKELIKHSWKGNVRELRNVIERVFLLRKDGIIDGKDICLGSSMPKNILYGGYNSLPRPKESALKKLIDSEPKTGAFDTKLAKQIREKLGFTQKSLAEELGLGKYGWTQISKLELGGFKQQNPTGKIVTKYLSLLKEKGGYDFMGGLEESALKKLIDSEPKTGGFDTNLAKQIREDLRLSLEKLAKEIGITKGGSVQVGNFEKGRFNQKNPRGHVVKYLNLLKEKGGYEFTKKDSSKKKVRGLRPDGRYGNELTKEDEQELNEILKKVDGNTRKAAKISSWSRNTFRRYQEKFLDIPEGKSGERLDVSTATASKYIKGDYEEQNNETTSVDEGHKKQELKDSALLESVNNDIEQKSKEETISRLLSKANQHNFNTTPKSSTHIKQKEKKKKLIKSDYNNSGLVSFDTNFAQQSRETSKYSPKELEVILGFVRPKGGAQILEFENGKYDRRNPKGDALLFDTRLKNCGYDSNEKLEGTTQDNDEQKNIKRDGIFKTKDVNPEDLEEDNFDTTIDAYENMQQPERDDFKEEIHNELDPKDLLF